MLSSKKSIAMLSSIVLGALSFNSSANANLELKPIDTTATDAQQNIKSIDFTQLKRATALHIAQQYQQLKPLLAREINANNQSVSLQTLSDLNQSKLSLDLGEFNQFKNAVISAKGYPSDTANLVELRLADQSMLSALEQGMTPLFAFEPAGDESQWQYVEAFDSQGNTHLLDVDVMPQRPVLVVDINAKSDLKAGLKQMKAVFASFANDSKSVATKDTQSAQTTTSVAALETSVLKKISLNDDEEPWISGKAEVYGIVTGVDSSREAPLLDVVDMPYLDHKDTNYYPNQVVIFWDRYRWSAADMILMEHDDNTNYQELAVALANTAGSIMAAIPDPTVQGLAVLGKITAALIQAMPSGWFSNDDDYLDVFYTIMKNSTYTNHYGASGNAKINLQPLTIN
ncbi:MAG: hypothetical protein ACI8WB_003444 [Phenylobacterium sp.]|jgi:hypothetical protein